MPSLERDERYPLPHFLSNKVQHGGLSKLHMNGHATGFADGHGDTHQDRSNLSLEATTTAEIRRARNNARNRPFSNRSVMISQRCADEPRPLKMIYIGAGISGICAVVEFLQRVPSLELIIYEKNPEVAGTWYENRYPGCACDVPAHAYQLSKESSTQWTSFFATAPEIFAYWKRIAKKYEVEKRVQFEQMCIGARWSETANKWFVQIKDLKTGAEYQDSCDVFMTGEGILNDWKWPDIKGIHDFKGPLLHSAKWDSSVNLKDKTVAVIGAGSSGLQIVPAILPEVKHMDHYVRGRGWVASLYGEGSTKARIEEGGGNFNYTPEEKNMWQNDREAYLEYRRAVEYDIQNKFGVVYKDSAKHAAVRTRTEESMLKRLKGKPELYDHLRPDHSPYCRRMSPGPGYLEALASDKVDTITCGIRNIDATGVVTNDGVHHDCDVVVCATGFQTSPADRSFPIYGIDGVNLRHRYSERPETYLGLTTDGFPNFFQSIGPNSMPGHGSLLLAIEKIHYYVGQIMERMAYDNIGRIEVKRRHVESFTNYCDEFFKHTVYSEECSSWYKTYEPGATGDAARFGRVTALWPGSSLQCVRAMSSVRWEDYNLDPYDGNDWGWFGNGWTLAEKFPEAELESLTWYLHDTKIMDADYELGNQGT